MSLLNTVISGFGACRRPSGNGIRFVRFPWISSISLVTLSASTAGWKMAKRRRPNPKFVIVQSSAFGMPLESVLREIEAVLLLAIFQSPRYLTL